MPVPLYPTCLDVCGCMVALGTREGPVLLFDVGPRPSGGAAPASSKERLKPRAVAATAGTTAAAAASASPSSKLGGSTSRDDSNRESRRGGSRPHTATAAGTAASMGTSTSGGTGRDGGNTTCCASVTRVYGSLADGTGPISSVILDRAKVIAAGRGSRRSGGGYVVRCGEEGHTAV